MDTSLEVVEVFDERVNRSEVGYDARVVNRYEVFGLDFFVCYSRH
jgi:hypothetical protein